MNYRIVIKIIILIFLILLEKYLRIYKTQNYFKEKEEIKAIKEKNINDKYNTNNGDNYSEKHIRILRESASECTLFLNNNKEFPIDNPTTVLLLGSGARETLKGGGGSGNVICKYTTCEEGLEKAGFTITTKEWLDQTKYSFLKNNKEPKSNIAIYVLSRNSGEAEDRRPIQGDLLLTNQEIRDILYLNKNYKKFMLVLNVCGIVDLSPIKEVSNILLLSQLGVVTGDILADIILGKQNPSGKLATTWDSLKNYKFLDEYEKIDDTNYIEGVYVGYRYFNSAGIKPLYPFGYGKSYTNFKFEKISLNNVKDEIIIKAKIKNIGKYPGKEVIQVYVSPSQENKDKPFQTLVSFKKTKELKPLEETEIELGFKLRNVARYDEKKPCYILDKGKYIIRVGNNSENTNIYGYIELNEDIITIKVKNISIKDLDFVDYKPKIILNDDLSNIQKIKLTKNDFDLKEIKYNYEYTINEKISTLKNEDLVHLCVGDYSDFLERMGIAGCTTKSVIEIKKYIRMSDGPAGLNIHTMNLEDSSTTTAIPIETALAQSFNIELVEKYGKIIANEMEVFNIQLWLAPALNIHRNILCGRNFEYFSEDPLITGKMASALVKSVQSYKNKGAVIKHFAANNQEKNRLNNNSKMSERALREIYLKGFQIAIEESQPYALMTSYNLINGIHPSANKELLIDILRNEFDFRGLIITDWLVKGMENDFSKYKAQNAFDNIKGGNNLIMPGSEIDYNILIEKLNQNLLTRDDLLYCSSKVYETIELLNQ